MTTDEFILLINAQWERGLIVPGRIHASDPLIASANNALDAGMVRREQYSVTSGRAYCYSLTPAGWLRLGEMIGAKVIVKPDDWLRPLTANGETDPD